MSNTAMALPKDHPLLIAWDEFCATDEFKNALAWAISTKYNDGRFISESQREEHGRGAMWLSFIKGTETK
jgi:hypothetical protein